MSSIKTYTDLKQSKILAEILSHNTADQTYERVAISGANLDIPEEMQYRHSDVQFKFYSGIGVPCWSLAALIDVLPEQFGRYTKTLYWFDDAWHCEYVDKDSEGKYGVTADDSVDVCVKMITKLKENNLL